MTVSFYLKKVKGLKLSFEITCSLSKFLINIKTLNQVFLRHKITTGSIHKI